VIVIIYVEVEMKLLRAMIVMVTIGFSTNSSAVIVDGAASCGQWAAGSVARSWAHIADTAWVLGYLSGKAVNSGADVLRNTDKASIVLWMDNYCNRNPLKDVGDGADSLFIELKNVQ